jgi:hypothetical protein
MRDENKIGSFPVACYVDADLEVKRLWDDEIRKILRDELSRDERLKALYLEIKEELGNQSPSLMDFVGNSHQVDPYIFIRHFGGWLRTRLYCEGELNEPERNLLDSPAEEFLKHVEMDLNPTRSFKMVVLLSILQLPGTEWQLEDIARLFLDYYVNHPDRLPDYEELARSAHPQQFPLPKVVRKLKEMPLKFLSNKSSDYFVLEKKRGIFSLKPESKEYWHQPTFKTLLKERVEFGLIRYFARRRGLPATGFPI